jgi:hypothetical protein
MKKIFQIIAIGFVLLHAVPARATYSIVATCHGIGQSSTTNTVTLSGVNCSGADIVWLSQSEYQGVSQGVITDSVNGGTGWTKLFTGNCGGANTPPCDGVTRVNLWYCQGCTFTSSMSFTDTCTGCYPTIALLGASGSVTSPLDGTPTSNVGTGISTLATGAITATSGDILITAFGSNLAGGVLSLQSPFTLGDHGVASGNSVGGAIGYYVSTGTSQNATWQNNTSSDMSALMGAFKTGSGGLTPAQKARGFFGILP